MCFPPNFITQGGICANSLKETDYYTCTTNVQRQLPDFEFPMFKKVIITDPYQARLRVISLQTEPLVIFECVLKTGRKESLRWGNLYAIKLHPIGLVLVHSSKACPLKTQQYCILLQPHQEDASQRPLGRINNVSMHQIHKCKIDTAYAASTTPLLFQACFHYLFACCAKIDCWANIPCTLHTLYANRIVVIITPMRNLSRMYWNRHTKCTHDGRNKTAWKPHQMLIAVIATIATYSEIVCTSRLNKNPELKFAGIRWERHRTNLSMRMRSGWS